MAFLASSAVRRRYDLPSMEMRSAWWTMRSMRAVAQAAFGKMVAQSPNGRLVVSTYLALHDATFLEKGINPLFIGTPGTGKTYLARGLAWRACQVNKRVVVVSAPRLLNELHGAELHGGLERVMRKYVKADLLVIDDFAVLAVDAAQAKLAFQVISGSKPKRHRECVALSPLTRWVKLPRVRDLTGVAETARPTRRSATTRGWGSRLPGGLRCLSCHCRAP